ncbi:S49 family peptidase [Lautropia mirabilis]
MAGVSGGAGFRHPALHLGGPVDEDQRRPASYVASINIEGVIVGGSGEEGVSADRVNKALRRAFADPRAVGVVLRINSPGGSPVQSGMIVDEMRRQRRLHPEKPLHAVIEEIGASGGYYIAAAADNIYVDKASIVGSIGVLLSNYGVQDTLKMLGIERRTQTAGKNKAFMDPTAPMSAEQKAHAQAMLDEVHRQFIDVVKQGRGQRLKETPETFSGLFWTGERSIQLGLADGLGSVDSVARDVLNTENVVDFSEYSRWQMLAGQFGAEAFGGFWKQVQTRIGGQEPVLR